MERAQALKRGQGFGAELDSQAKRGDDDGRQHQPLASSAALLALSTGVCGLTSANTGPFHHYNNFLS
jgi:hypothetical protein